MSEFSSSVHIYTKDSNEVIEKLKALDFPLVVAGANKRTITILLDHKNIELLPKSFNYLSYNHAEDHGLWYYFQTEKQEIKIELSWDDPIAMGYDPEMMPKPVITDNFQKLLSENGFISIENEEMFKESILKFKALDWEEKEKKLSQINEVLGLYKYSWLSFDYCFNHQDIFKEENPEAIFINL